MAKHKAHALHYVGDGRFLIGVPARDLMAAEVERLGGSQALLASGLYRTAEGDDAGSDDRTRALPAFTQSEAASASAADAESADPTKE